MMERAVTLLPLPDSPTIPIVSPASSENETPSTALTTPSWVRKCVLRLFTSSIATGYSSRSKWPLAARTDGYSTSGGAGASADAMARGDPVLRADLAPHGLIVAARFGGVGAAGSETATRRGIHGRRHVAFEYDAFAL